MGPALSRAWRCRDRILAGGAVAALLALSPPTWAQSDDDATRLEDVQAEFSEAFDAIGDYSADQRDEALDAIDATLGRIDDRIDDLEQRVRNQWSEMSEATQENTSAALSALRERRNRLSEAFGALSQGAGTAWQDLLAGVRTGWADLERAWDEAAAAMRPETETED